jgi:hypothetical protein
MLFRTVCQLGVNKKHFGPQLLLSRHIIIEIYVSILSIRYRWNESFCEGGTFYCLLLLFWGVSLGSIEARSIVLLRVACRACACFLTHAL